LVAVGVACLVAVGVACLVMVGVACLVAVWAADVWAAGLCTTVLDAIEGRVAVPGAVGLGEARL
jgi:hypothetical protein